MQSKFKILSILLLLCLLGYSSTSTANNNPKHKEAINGLVENLKAKNLEINAHHLEAEFKINGSSTITFYNSAQLIPYPGTIDIEAIDQNRFFISYNIGGTLRVCVGTTTNNTITYGTPLALSTNSFYSNVKLLSSGSFIFLSTLQIPQSIIGQIGTISGNNLSISSVTNTINTSSSTNALYSPEIELEVVNSTTFLYHFSDQNLGTNKTLQVGTVNGNTITMGNSVTVDNGGNIYTPTLTKMNNSSVLVTYTEYVSPSNQHQKNQIAIINNGTLSLGTSSTHSSFPTSKVPQAFVINNSTILFIDGSTYKFGTISGNNISYGNSTTWKTIVGAVQLNIYNFLILPNSEFTLFYTETQLSGIPSTTYHYMTGTINGTNISFNPEQILTFKPESSIVLPSGELILGYDGGYLGINTVSATVPVTCSTPSGMTASNTTSTSTQLAWTAGASEPDWEIQYGASGFTLGNGTTVSANNNNTNFTLSNLTAGTTYDIYYRASCVGGDYSYWVGPVQVTTVSSLDVTFEGTTCQNTNELLIDIKVDNVTDPLGAISLVFDYDNTLMEYDVLESSHTNLGVTLNTNTFINDVNGKMYISWASNNTATVANGDVLFTLKFKPAASATSFSSNGTTNLAWDETVTGNCEFADGSQNILGATFTDGTGTLHAAPTATLTNDVTNNTICDGDAINFTASGGATFEFFINSNTQGTASATTTFTPSSALADQDEVKVLVVDANGCEDDEINTITVNALPTVDLASDDSDSRVCNGTVINFTGSGADEYTFKVSSVVDQAQSATATYAHTATVDGAVISVVGVVTATGCEADGATTFTLDVDNCYNAAGSIVYKNAAETPMGNVGMSLDVSGNAPLAATTTTGTNDGTFSFANLFENETYDFSGTTAKTHGGINSTDALGIILESLTPGYYVSGSLELKAADPDNSGTVNATDAQLVMKRFVQEITSFTGGDWVFEDKSYTLTGSLTGEKIYALAMGDVNGSYEPSITENADPSVFLATNGTMQVADGDQVQIPVSIQKGKNIGAISLSFYFPSHLMSVNGVQLANGNNVLYSVNGDELRIAWADLNDLQLLDNELIFNIDATIIDAADLIHYPLGVNLVSEIADEMAMPYDSVTLVVPVLENMTTGVNGIEAAAPIAIRNFPNPFSHTSTIEYELPNTGDVILTIRNTTGQLVKVLVNETQAAGKQQVTVNADDLANGTYFYTITVQESNTSYTVTKRMVILK